MVKIQTEVDGYRWGGGGQEGEGIRRSWMCRALISISVIRIQVVFQTDVSFCYKCSRQVSGSALDSIGFIFSIPSGTCLLEFYCRILSSI